MAKRPTYPESRYMTARLAAIADALFGIRRVLKDYREVLTEGMPSDPAAVERLKGIYLKTLEDAEESVKVAMRAWTGDDEGKDD